MITSSIYGYLAGERLGEGFVYQYLFLPEATCTTEMSLLMACWKQNEFSDAACAKEIQTFYDCVAKTDMGARIAGFFCLTVFIVNNPLECIRQLCLLKPLCPNCLQTQLNYGGRL
uniref:Uncharacterized protein n=1 Tax=Chelydra serpentina TaxID=8475 RepID=A0A8C3S8Y3_CHESE